MNYDNSEKLGSDLTATEKFVIHSMTKKIQDDWDIFAKVAQEEIDSEYNRIGSQSRVHSDTAFLQQRIDRIDTIKRSVEEARRTKSTRQADLEKIQIMLERNNK